MRSNPSADISRTLPRIVSVLAGFAVALTLVRFGAAHFQAERAK